jgi:hypothetical protein
MAGTVGTGRSGSSKVDKSTHPVAAAIIIPPATNITNIQIEIAPIAKMLPSCPSPLDDFAMLDSWNSTDYPKIIPCLSQVQFCVMLQYRAGEFKNTFTSFELQLLAGNIRPAPHIFWAWIILRFVI